MEPGEPKDDGIYCHLCADSFQLEAHTNLTEAKFYDCDDFVLEPSNDEHALADRGRPQFKEINRRLRLRGKARPKRRLRKKTSEIDLNNANERGIPPPPKVPKGFERDPNRPRRRSTQKHQDPDLGRPAKRLIRGRPETRLMTRIGPHEDTRLEGQHTLRDQRYIFEKADEDEKGPEEHP